MCSSLSSHDRILQFVALFTFGFPANPVIVLFLAMSFLRSSAPSFAFFHITSTHRPSDNGGWCNNPWYDTNPKKSNFWVIYLNRRVATTDIISESSGTWHPVNIYLKTKSILNACSERTTLQTFYEIITQ